MGHHLTGKKQTREHITNRLNSEGYKNRICIPWNKGTKGLQVAWNRGISPSPEQEAKRLASRGYVPAWNKGVNTQLNTGRTHFKPGCVSLRKGKSMSPESIKKMSISLTGRKQSESTKRKRALSLRGKCLGEKSHFWRGGINPLRMVIRDLSEACEWRKAVFERDEYTCKFCGLHGGYLEAHHLKRFSVIFHEFLERYSMLSPIGDKYRLVELARKHEPFWCVSNGITLCRDCHNTTKGENHGCFNTDPRQEH